MQNKVFIRADGSTQIGLGHLVRCIALAQMLKENFVVHFFSLAIPDGIGKDIIDEGFIIKKITCEDDFFSQLSGSEIVVLDHYDLDSNYQKRIKEIGSKLVCIDDLHDKEFFADLIINHAPGIIPKDYAAQRYTQFALGIDYAILRPLFIRAAKIYKKTQGIKDVFVCFGGSDIYDLTHKCVNAILKIEEIDTIYVVLGGAYKHERILDLVKEREDKIVLCRNLSENEMLVTMNKCQLAIVPTSTICYEVCSVKMVVLGGYYINNQINIYKGFVDQDLIFDGGDFSKYKAYDFENKIKEIMLKSNAEYQKKLDNQHKVFDGNQKKRFLNLIEEMVVC